MKTNPVMKNTFFESLVFWLTNLSTFWKYLINGVVGAVVISIYRKEKFVDTLRKILIGGPIAAYFTTLIVEKTGMSIASAAFTSFVCGILGGDIINNFYLYMSRNRKKISKAIKILFGSN